MKAAINEILFEANIKEFKWEKLKGHMYYRCGKKFIHVIFRNIFDFNLRADTITWDTHDSRHKIRGRDDIANYERMFFHLLNNSMKRRPKGSIWHIRPDVLGAIDWDTVRDCLYNVGKRREYRNSIFGEFFTEPYFRVVSFKEKHSHEEVLIQVPDLFSGLSVFSRAHYDKYRV